MKQADNGVLLPYEGTSGSRLCRTVPDSRISLPDFRTVSREHVFGAPDLHSRFSRLLTQGRGLENKVNGARLLPRYEGKTVYYFPAKVGGISRVKFDHSLATLSKSIIIQGSGQRKIS